MADAQACDLAWSIDDGVDDDIAVPRAWRAVYRNAIGLVTVGLAVAGAVVVIDQHWPQPSVAQASSWSGVPPVSASALPTPDPPAPGRPTYSAAIAEHLSPPPPANPGADAIFLTGLQRTGSMITDVPAAIASGHSACTDLANGFTPEQVASAVMDHNRTLSAVNALGMVYSAVAAYCPEYAAGR
ncbi:MAG: DUF732 domain-containing protein [Actinomycetota bacterium]|nr:DUF732 domain-containing protein [Actinomycetota bacterium]